MKLLLTSAGITNDSINNALKELLNKPASNTKVAVIPTAANAEEGDKAWFIYQNFNSLYEHGFKSIDLVDPSADGVDWRARLENADVLFVSGGNTFHLLDQFRKTGFDQWLKDNLDDKVYVGVSAGSIVVTRSIEVASIEPADRNLPGIKDLTGLGLIDFEIELHCNEERFQTMRQWAQKNGRELYALDDQSAVKVDGETVDVISEGTWELYKKAT